MSVRWECPNGCSPAKLGPERPRKNDVRRYCLKCSERTGVLVERTAPTLERKRALGRSATVERQKAKHAKVAAKWIVPTVDAVGVEHEVNVRTTIREALGTMGFFDGWAYGQKPTMADVEINLRRGNKARVSGRAHLAGFHITLTVPRVGCQHEELLEVLYHEAAHASQPYGTAAHGPEFRRLLADALQKRWPFLVYGSVTDGTGAYPADYRIRKQMREHVRDGGTL